PSRAGSVVATFGLWLSAVRRGPYHSYAIPRNAGDVLASRHRRRVSLNVTMVRMLHMVSRDRSRPISIFDLPVGKRKREIDLGCVRSGVDPANLSPCIRIHTERQSPGFATCRLF